MVPPLPSFVFLVGMMGCGKSTVGLRLADLLRANFVDLDQAIETETGSSIPDLFARGEYIFRDVEHATLARTVAKPSVGSTIVATGGGTPCDARNIELMKQVGVSVYLQTTPAALFQRLLTDGETARRPLLSSAGEMTSQRIEALLEQRKPYYARADWTTDASAPAEVIARRIAAWYYGLGA